MEIKIIRKRSKDYHSRGSLVGLIVGEFYRLAGRADALKEGKGKKLSFKYVEWKAVALSDWAVNNGVAAHVWLEGMKGTIRGLMVMVHLIDAIEWHCKLLGIKCDALLLEGWKGLEGLEIEVDCGDYMRKGTLISEGKYILYHKLMGEGRVRPRVLKPYDIKGVKIV